MYDRFNRKINYLRISVTDRCNLRCVYCMPAEGVELMSHNDILSFEEIVEFTKKMVADGVDKVRITGGEPLVRKDIIELIKSIGKIEGIKDFAMTTNGIFLPKYARQLKAAGMMRVNISLDTMDPKRYTEITRLGKIEGVFAGIEAAKEAGLFPIKINCVIKKSRLEPDAAAVAEYCEANGLEIRYIHEMNLETGEFSIVEGGEGGDCKNCNRLRLTANGDVMPCLFSDLSYSVRELGIEKSLVDSLKNKPRSGTSNHSGKFNNIGG
jgi:cyclic pyranopterin phosphate synthase